MKHDISKNRQIKVAKLSDDDNAFDLRTATPEQRWAMMWQIALDAWAFKGEIVAEPRLQRNIIRVFRRKS